MWDELCEKYYSGTDSLRSMYDKWLSLERGVDPQVFLNVKQKLERQMIDAAAWRDACLTYFQRFSKRPIVHQR